MKKLDYKGIIFDSFAFSDKECKIYIDESNAETLNGFEDGWGYVCPHCIKKYELYKEVNLTEKNVDDIIKDDYVDDYVCCVEGCYNKNAYDINFSSEYCKLI